MSMTDFHNGRVNKSCARESQLVVAVTFWHYKLKFLYLVIKPNARENQQQHIIRTKWIHYDFCIIVHLFASGAAEWLYCWGPKLRENDAPVFLWLWFHWVAGLLGGRKPAPLAPVFSHLLGRAENWIGAGPHRNSNTACNTNPNWYRRPSTQYIGTSAKWTFGQLGRYC